MQTAWCGTCRLVLFPLAFPLAAGLPYPESRSGTRRDCLCYPIAAEELKKQNKTRKHILGDRPGRFLREKTGENKESPALWFVPTLN